MKAPVDVDGYLLARRPTIVAKRAASAPIIDGYRSAAEAAPT